MDLEFRSLVDADLVFPGHGAWTLHAVLDLDDAISGAVTLVIDSLRLSGAIVQGGEFAGTQTVRVVGGAGKLSETCKPRGYRNVSAQQVAQDICSGVGERLSSSVALSSTLSFWSILGQPAGSALDALARKLGDGFEWRVANDGTIWIGEDTWPKTEIDPLTLAFDPSRGVLQLGCDYPTLQAGVTLDGRKIARVRHRVCNAEILTEAWTV